MRDNSRYRYRIENSLRPGAKRYVARVIEGDVQRIQGVKNQLMSPRTRPDIAAPRRTIALDTDRRHLVFGDLHGRHESFLRLLDAVAHDPAADTLYCVGDLIDRGPDAVSVVRAFEGEHRHAVRGNHEQMVLDPEAWEEVWSQPGTGGPDTWRSLEEHGLGLDWLAAFAASLPVRLDVGADGEEGAFRLIHAESPFDWSEADLDRHFDTTSALGAGEGRPLWGRRDVERVLRSCPSDDARPASPIASHPLRSRRAVFCGHTPTIDVVEANGTRWIDTFAGGVMTCVDALTMEIHEVPLAAADRS